MKDQHGCDMARLGDTTDHGGKVIEASQHLTNMGIPVALDGHLVECPKCDGKFPIIATARRTHRGIRVGYLGDKRGGGPILTLGYSFTEPLIFNPLQSRTLAVAGAALATHNGAPVLTPVR